MIKAACFFIVLGIATIQGVQSQTTETFLFPKSTLVLSEIAAFLSLIAYESDPTNFPYPINYYLSEPDAALTTKWLVPSAEGSSNDFYYCIAAFRGTDNELWKSNTVAAIQDWSQNLAGQEVTLTGTCTASQGIYSAYNHQYQLSIDQDLTNCMQECEASGSTECNVVLTGHSQGGAVANVAGVLLSNLNPYVITFGQPPTLGEGCLQMINTARWYRFIQAIPDGTGLKYDGVPSLLQWLQVLTPGMNIYGTLLGNELVISSDDAASVRYVGDNVHDDQLPYSIDAHHISMYLDTLKALVATVPGPYVPTSGFSSGSACTINVECASGDCVRANWFSLFRQCA